MKISHATKRLECEKNSTIFQTRRAVYAFFLLILQSPLVIQGDTPDLTTVWTQGPGIQGVGQIAKTHPTQTNSIHQYTENAAFVLQHAGEIYDIDTGQKFNCDYQAVGGPFDSPKMVLSGNNVEWYTSGMGQLVEEAEWEVTYYPSSYSDAFETGVTVSCIVKDLDQYASGEEVPREWQGGGLTVFQVGVQAGSEYIWENRLFGETVFVETSGLGLHSSAETGRLERCIREQQSSGWGFEANWKAVTRPSGADPLKNICFSVEIRGEGTAHLQGMGSSTFGESAITFGVILFGSAGTLALPLTFVWAAATVATVVSNEVLNEGTSSGVAFAGESVIQYGGDSKSSVPIFNGLTFNTNQWETLASCGLNSVFDIPAVAMSLRPGDTRHVSARGNSKSLVTDESIWDWGAARVITTGSVSLYHITSVPEYK